MKTHQNPRSMERPIDDLRALRARRQRVKRTLLAVLRHAKKQCAAQGLSFEEMLALSADVSDE